jgi:hypothetical protein
MQFLIFLPLIFRILPDHILVPVLPHRACEIAVRSKHAPHICRFTSGQRSPKPVCCLSVALMRSNPAAPSPSSCQNSKDTILNYRAVRLPQIKLSRNIRSLPLVKSFSPYIRIRSLEATIHVNIRRCGPFFVHFHRLWARNKNNKWSISNRAYD